MSGFARRFANAVEVAAAISTSQQAQDTATAANTSAANGAGLMGFSAARAYPANSVGAAIRSVPTSPEQYGADPSGVADSTAAINTAMAASDHVVGAGAYLATGAIIFPRSGVSLHLRRLAIGAPVSLPAGAYCKLKLSDLSPTNAFPMGSSLTVLGAPGDTARQYAIQVDIDTVTGRSPDGTTRAHVLRNYNATFSDFRLDRTLNTLNVYTCDQPAVPLGDNKVRGTLIENADFGMYLHGVAGGGNHVEHHELNYQFVTGARFGAVYARGRAHFQRMVGAYDFNGQGLVKIVMGGSAITEVIGQQVQGTSSLALGTIVAIEGDAILCQKVGGAFTVADGINGKGVTAVTDYKPGGPYLDFVSQTEAGFARHTLDCAFLTDLFGNNQEDWIVFSARGESNQRAQIAGQAFIASAGEQYVQLSKPVYSIRYSATQVQQVSATQHTLRNANGVAVVSADAGSWSAADGSGNNLMSWTRAGGLQLGQWGGAQGIAANRNITFVGSSHAGPHLVFGINHLWVDASGKLRIKSSQPASDLDGVIVGAQA